LRAARANRVFHTDEKRIRMENTVIDKSKDDWGLPLSKILDCARMCFSSVRNRGSARTGRRPRKLDHCGSIHPLASADTRPSSLGHPDKMPSSIAEDSWPNPSI
jgi:hypothetical protein